MESRVSKRAKKLSNKYMNNEIKQGLGSRIENKEEVKDVFISACKVLIRKLYNKNSTKTTITLEGMTYGIAPEIENIGDWKITVEKLPLSNLSQINTSLIADEVLKVFREQIEDLPTLYNSIEHLISKDDILDLLDNLSPHK